MPILKIPQFSIMFFTQKGIHITLVAKTTNKIVAKTIKEVYLCSGNLRERHDKKNSQAKQIFCASK